VLVDEYREAGTLAALKAERATVVARGKRIETEATPIRYVAELLGVDTNSEKAIRWLIALMVLCCDPLAIALTAMRTAPPIRRCALHALQGNEVTNQATRAHDPHRPAQP
jgi:hypothetical protein